MCRTFASIVIMALAVAGCRHPALSTHTSPDPSHASERLSHPEQVIVPPEHAEWPRPVSTGQFPHYPPYARRDGVEARVIVELVVGHDGRPEPRTISILQSSPAHPEFASSVCTFLRSGATFSWDEQPPARALVVTPFEFTLSGGVITEGLPPMPDLQAIRDSLRQMSPTELASWVESKAHCF